MEWSPKLDRRRSVTLTRTGALHISNWCDASRHSYAAIEDYHYDYDSQALDYTHNGTRASGRKRRGLLWRILRGKKRIFALCSASANFQYNPHTYAQNFDDGSVWHEPEDSLRSFSARFANPFALIPNSR